MAHSIQLGIIGVDNAAIATRQDNVGQSLVLVIIKSVPLVTYRAANTEVVPWLSIQPAVVAAGTVSAVWIVLDE